LHKHEIINERFFDESFFTFCRPSLFSFFATIQNESGYLAEACSDGANPGHNAKGQNATDKNNPGQNATFYFA